MSLVIELRPEAHALLSFEAIAQGLTVETYAGSLLEAVLVTERARGTRLEREEFQNLLEQMAACQAVDLPAKSDA